MKNLLLALFLLMFGVTALSQNYRQKFVVKSMEDVNSKTEKWNNKLCIGVITALSTTENDFGVSISNITHKKLGTYIDIKYTTFNDTILIYNYEGTEKGKMFTDVYIAHVGIRYNFDETVNTYAAIGIQHKIEKIEGFNIPPLSSLNLAMGFIIVGKDKRFGIQTGIEIDIQNGIDLAFVLGVNVNF